MADNLRPTLRGRGAALLEAQQRAMLLLEQRPGEPAAEESRPPIKGRGSMLFKALKKVQDEKPGEPTGTPEIPKPRGRAALLQKMHELQLEKQVGEMQKPTSSHVEQETVSQASYVDEVCKYQGTDGTSVSVTANYIRLSVDSNKGVFEYEVVMHPDVESKNVRIKLINSQLPQLGGVKMFDGAYCLYLPVKLPETRTQLQATHPVSGSPVLLEIIYKKKKRLGDCLHLFNVLFKRVMSALMYFQFNRNYYDMKAAILVPAHKLEVLPGYVITADEYEGGVMLCLDSHHRVLRTQTVWDILLMLKSSARERFKTEATNLIMGSVVLTRYNNKTYVVDEILWDASPKDTFMTSAGEKVSFVDYYKQQHGLHIKDANQPLLLHRKSVKVSGKAEKEDKLLCLVPELCHLTGLTDAMRSDFRVMQDVAQFTRLAPSQRMHALVMFLKNVRESPQSQKILSDWGLAIEDATIDLNARILRPEKICFGEGAAYMCDHKNDWNTPLSRFKLTGPVDLTKWIVIFVEKDYTSIKEFVEMMTRLGPAMGCTIKPPQLHSLKNDRTGTFVDACNNLIQDWVQCVVFVFPTQRTDLYSTIKKICCVKTPVASQVILSRTLNNRKRVRSIVQKIALQINCKLGGSLWSLQIPVKNWMVCGIDTYHSKGRSQSVCGFVASLNEVFTRWYSLAFMQDKEVGDHLKLCFTRSLEKYREINGTFPHQVVIYRDGVGDGQLQHCLDYEVQQFLDCIREFDMNIKICMVVVQKRINTRVFLKKGRDLVNPGPGTIMDHTVTRRNMADFFLISQHVNQGTVTPTHYVIVHDDAKLKVDHVQRLTYKMCHLYYNWAGTIRVPAPCQYSHKLASLVGQHLGKIPPECLYNRLYYL